MRALRYASYGMALAFFLLFQGLHVARTVRLSRLSAYSRALVEFLGMRTERERYLFVRYGGKVRGYSGLKVERLFDRPDARYRVSIEGFAPRLIPFLGSRGDVSLDAELTLNDRGEIMRVTADLSAATETVRFAGEKQGDSLPLHILRGDRETGLTVELPAELGIGGAVFPVPPIGDLRVGEERSFSYFDPLTQRRAECRVHAVERTQLSQLGIKMEALIVEVATPAGRYTVTTAPDGEVLRVAGPGGIELVRATSLEVRSYFSRNRNRSTSSQAEEDTDD